MLFKNRGCPAECQTVYFKHANHWLYLEEPDVFNALLVAFARGEKVDPIVQDYSNRISLERP
jgi:hypothetical protein